MRTAILTVSDSRKLETDHSGALLVERLEAAGHPLAERSILPDDIYAIRARVSAWIADPGIDLIISTGGTGLTGRDGTPEAIAPLLDKRIEGFGELFRQLSFAEIGPATLQSRALAGVANGHLVFCLPGSTAAVRLAWEAILQPQLDPATRPCNFPMLLPRLKEK